MLLPEKQQHKKCCEILREALLTETNREIYLQEYHKLIDWMALTETATTVEEIQNCFHWHKEKAELFLQEHNLLPFVKTGDNADGLPYLPIDIFLDRLRSNHNIGSILRTAEALRLGAIFFSDGMSTPSHPQIQKTSMSTSSWVTTQANSSLDTLKRPIIALETLPTATAYYDFTFPDSFTLALGNEESGCSEKTLSLADHFIQIPLYGKKNSLNVAAAFAICASEITRQKREKI